MDKIKRLVALFILMLPLAAYAQIHPMPHDGIELQVHAQGNDLYEFNVTLSNGSAFQEVIFGNLRVVNNCNETVSIGFFFTVVEPYSVVSFSINRTLSGSCFCRFTATLETSDRTATASYDSGTCP